MSFDFYNLKALNPEIGNFLFNMNLYAQKGCAAAMGANVLNAR